MILKNAFSILTEMTVELHVVLPLTVIMDIASITCLYLRLRQSCARN